MNVKLKVGALYLDALLSVSLTGNLSGSTMRRVDVNGIFTPPAYVPILVGALVALVVVFGVGVEVFAIVALP